MPLMNTTEKLELRRLPRIRVAGLARQLARAGRHRALLEGSTANVVFNNGRLGMLQLATSAV